MAKTRRRNKIKAEAIFEPILKFVLRNIYIVVIVIILILIGNGVYRIALTSDYFIVKDIEPRRIEGNSSAFDSSIKFKIEKGINIFKLDLKKYQQVIEESHPEIKDIIINRALPDRIVVYFKKRIPAFQIKSGLYYLVSQDAVVLPNPKIYPASGLFIVKGIHIDERRLRATNKRLSSASMQRALQLIQELQQTDFDKKYKIAEIDVRDDSNPVIYLENGIGIILGRRSFTDKKSALLEVLKDLESKKLQPKSIDLRFDDVVVTP